MPINSTNNTVCVGQQMNMTNIITGVPTTAITYWKWSIPGANGSTTSDTAIYGYAPTAQNSNYTNLVTPTNYLTNSTGIPFCNFYWTAPGTNQVSCTTVIYGQTNTVTATLNVLGPNATESATHGTIAADMNFHIGSTPVTIPFLHFGDTVTTPGMTFSQTTTSPPPTATGFTFAGTNAWVQVLTNTTVGVTPIGGTTVTKTTFGCDGGRGNNFPYPNASVGANTSTMEDSPGAPLTSANYSVSRNFNATTYVMWRCTNAPNGDATILVPLKSYQWNWSGTATNGAPSAGWGLDPSTTNYPDSPNTNIAATNEPTWATNAAYNYH